MVTNRTVLYFCASLWYWFSGMGFQFQFLVRVSVTGLFVPLHFHSRERTGHRENFRSRGTFVPWNIRSRGAKSPRTFVPWIFRSCRTFAPQERMFQKTFVPWNFRTLGTFAPQTTFMPFNFRSCGLLAVITATRACGSLVKQR